VLEPHQFRMSFFAKIGITHTHNTVTCYNSKNQANNCQIILLQSIMEIHNIG